MDWVTRTPCPVSWVLLPPDAKQVQQIVQPGQNVEVQGYCRHGHPWQHAASYFTRVIDVLISQGCWVCNSDLQRRAFHPLERTDIALPLSYVFEGSLFCLALRLMTQLINFILEILQVAQ